MFKWFKKRAHNTLEEFNKRTSRRFDDCDEKLDQIKRRMHILDKFDINNPLLVDMRRVEEHTRECNANIKHILKWIEHVDHAIRNNTACFQTLGKHAQDMEAKLDKIISALEGTVGGIISIAGNIGKLGASIDTIDAKIDGEWPERFQEEYGDGEKDTNNPTLYTSKVKKDTNSLKKRILGMGIREFISNLKLNARCTNALLADVDCSNWEVAKDLLDNSACISTDYQARLICIPNFGRQSMSQLCQAVYGDGLAWNLWDSKTYQAPDYDWQRLADKLGIK